MINAKILQRCLSLDEKNFFNLEQFLTEISSYLSEKKLDYGKFEQLVRRKLNIKSNMSLFFQKLDKNFKGEELIDIDEKGNLLIEKWSTILITLLDAFNLPEILYSNNKQFIAIINYIMENYDKKEQFEKCLDQLIFIGINAFYYNKNYNFMSVYDTVILKDSIETVYSDGVKKWLGQNRTNTYSFELQSAHYIISSIKRVSGSFEYVMELNSLDFDLSSLPKKEELTNISILPEIDYKTVSSKTRAVNTAYELDNSIIIANQLLDSYSNYVLSLKETNEEEVAEEAKTVSSIMSVIERLNLSKEKMLKNYEEGNIISDEELNKSLLKRLIYKKNNE